VLRPPRAAVNQCPRVPTWQSAADAVAPQVAPEVDHGATPGIALTGTEASGWACRTRVGAHWPRLAAVWSR